MYLDVSPPVLGAVVLEGNLVFDEALGADADLWLQAGWILLLGGDLRVGSELSPFPGKARITLHGSPDSPELPLYGAKTIAVREGNLQLFGRKRAFPWTVLQANAVKGATQITVLGNVMSDWQAGERIVIASSSFYANEVDEVTIKSVGPYTAASNTTVVQLETPLNYDHLGVFETVSGDPWKRRVDMRAEVIMLNRSVIVEGDATSQRYLYGGQIQIHTPRGRPRANAQLEYVELRYMGQGYLLGRYTIHWHMHGNANFQSWMHGCSIHHTYNRAATIHGTHNITTSDCVVYGEGLCLPPASLLTPITESTLKVPLMHALFITPATLATSTHIRSPQVAHSSPTLTCCPADVMGHAFFLEDGIETGNVYERNVAMLVRRSDALLNTDTTPAVFWVTNPNNTYRHNRAAGSNRG